MTQDIVQYTVNDIRQIGETIAKSKLFGVNTPEQAIALCMVAHAEGRHPAMAAKDYDIIQNKPAKKAEAMLRDFQAAGGKVEWHELTNEVAIATFSHPSGGSFKCDWNMARAAAAGLNGKDNWKKFPRAMLRSRCVSEGVKTIYPAATSGMYTPEEVRDFEPVKSPMAQWAETEPSRPVIEQKKTEEIDLKSWASSFAQEIKSAETQEDIANLQIGARKELEQLKIEEPAYSTRIKEVVEQRVTELAPEKKDKQLNDDLQKSEELK